MNTALRPIEYWPLDYSENPADLNRVRCTGFFHQWVVCKEVLSGSEYTLALITREDGSIFRIDPQADQMKFLSA